MRAKPEVTTAWVALDAGQVQALLPHRYPFLMVDRAFLHPDRWEALGFKGVTYNEPFFPGHFPQEPVLPGVLMVEAIAQVAALTVLWRHPEARHRPIYLLGIEQARFRQKVVPGHLLEVHAWRERQRGMFVWFKGVIWVGDQVVAEARLSTGTPVLAEAKDGCEG
jgi:3-hydroxyacyl-[acyl-carrier-protein] dehydratase